jgi:hypothetical protein
LGAASSDGEATIRFGRLSDRVDLEDLMPWTVTHTDETKESSS